MLPSDQRCVGITSLPAMSGAVPWELSPLRPPLGGAAGADAWRHSHAQGHAHFYIWQQGKI